MKIEQIRNATLRIQYAGKHFLVDPFLGDKGSYPPFPNSARQDQNNPLEELPIPKEQLIDGIDALIITHLHMDHYDEAAKEFLPKHLPLFSQNEEDAQVLRNDGFTNVNVLGEDTSYEGISLIKTQGEHGRGEILKMTGLVCGVVFQHEDEKTLYIAGDTVWYEGVQQEIDAHQPEVIVLNAGDNQFTEGGSLVMDKEDVLQTHKAAPQATLIASHMEAVNHWALSREELKIFAVEHGFSDKLHVPQDGEAFEF
ncbi:MBL fold metallo-hydrolase [Planococcus sp. CP5-4]|uniref:MBL fold metallo-hydrolase n=1 Tax=unclassified Planococcus (in: firmicutes) TaxID=2662419 RepID=UPI001C223284|nr:MULTISPECIES: MBL fold metallo-hydrolase [unclassified Planococcus (in: firmicutes)]MBU9673741.1 MBL fold metallo-hydrolase [Planococcus sp. CP5-4_YE]MBV0908031.1 MBL fold metallo-hydrolase [Planococcus sp. CP5-4_UN]MBW6063198.1 MBL fold metallo-hydrolase [Planococcus sp. CP5-4]